MNRYFISTLVAILCLMHGAVTYGQYEKLRSLSFTDRYARLDSIYIGPSGIEQISQIKDWAAQRHIWAIELEAALILNVRANAETPTEKQHKTEAFQQLIKDTGKHGLTYLQAQTMHEYGLYLWRISADKNIAYDNLFTAYGIYHKVRPDKFKQKAFNLYDLGHIFYGHQDYESSTAFFKEAFDAGKATQYHNLSLLTNSLGTSYRNMGKYDSAHYYFDFGIEYARSKKDSVWSTLLSGNKGYTYYMQKLYDQAEPLLRLDMEYSLKSGDVINASNSMAIIAKLYNNRGLLKEAEALALRARQLSLKGHLDYKNRRFVFEALSTIYAQTGRPGIAALYSDSMRVMNDSIEKANNRLEIVSIAKKYDYEKYKANNQKLKDNIRQSRIIGIAIIIIFVLVLMTAYQIVSKLKVKQNETERRAKSEAELARQERINAEQQLSLAQKRLEEYTTYLAEKDKLIEIFEERIESLSNKANEAESKEIVQELKQTRILTEDEWERFTYMFEKVYPDFFTTIKREIPDISPAELRFVALAKLNSSTKQIAAMLGIGVDAVRMNKYRLLRKLNLSEEDSFEQWIERV